MSLPNVSRSIAAAIRQPITVSTRGLVSATSKVQGSKNESRLDARKEFPTCVKKTNVQICGDLYQEYKALGFKRYVDAPRDGLAVEAEFFDNRELVGSSPPATVLMVPGSPGYYTHYSYLISHLTNLGVRVISPNLPTLTLTKKTKFFRHSPPERAEFVKAILEQLNVSSVDLLASHSSGTFTGMQLHKDSTAPTIKSLAWFNPLGFEITVPMQPYWFSRGFVKTYQSDAGRFLLEKIGVPFLVHVMRNPFARNKLEDIIWGGCCLHYNDRATMKKDCEGFVEKNVPMLVVLADNDAVMNKKMNHNLLTAVGTNSEDGYIYDKEGKLERVGLYSDRLKLIRFRSGGHFAFIKYPEIVNKAVVDHLEKQGIQLADHSDNQNNQEWEPREVAARVLQFSSAPKVF